MLQYSTGSRRVTMIVHKNFMAPDRRGNPYITPFKNEHTRKIVISDKERADQIEISEEAMKCFESAKIIDLDKTRLKKEARDIFPIIKELMGSDGDARIIIRLQKIIDLREKIVHGEAPWDNDTVITEIGERLLS
jgi:hypothetical protein